MRVTVGVGVLEGVKDGDGVNDGVGDAVGGEVCVGDGVKVAVAGGGVPMTVKKFTWYQSYPKNNCT